MKSRLPFVRYSDYPKSEFLDREFLRLTDVAKNELGFSWLGIATIDKSVYPIPSVECFSNVPRQWAKDYSDNELSRADPLLQHGLSSTRRLAWDINTLKKSPRFASFAEKLGYKAGVCQSMRDIFGLIHYVVLMSDKALYHEDFQHIDANVSHFMLSVQDVLEAYYMSEKAQEYNALSSRELEVLRWAAGGKTAAETALILGISERTVNYHLSNCADKLRVHTKTQTLLKAIAINIL